jgi:hypothetical protein
MACCLTRYRYDFVEASEEAAAELGEKFKMAKNFTPLAFQQQLRRALAAYNWILEFPKTGNPVPSFPLPPYAIECSEGCIVDDYDDAVESGEEFTHFLPWNTQSRPAPWSLVPAAKSGEKRPCAEQPESDSETRQKRSKRGDSVESEEPFDYIH